MHHASRVFVVDDEPLIASTLTTILNMNGFSADCFTDPTAALKVPVAEMPDLLISDVMMPQLSGIELAIRMRDQKPDLRVLLISGQAGTTDLLEGARQLGHNFKLLEKPIPPQRLLFELRLALTPDNGPTTKQPVHTSLAECRPH